MSVVEEEKNTSVTVTPKAKEALESIRKKYGLRSLAETVETIATDTLEKIKK